MVNEAEISPLYPQTPTVYGVQNGTGQGTAVSPKFRFSPEELRVMRECGRESFYYRCLPFAAAGIIAVQYFTKTGVLKAHHRWGTTLKSIGAGFAGWILGKMSYQKKCEDKLMQLPNSQLAELLRRKRGYTIDMSPYERDMATLGEAGSTSPYSHSSGTTQDYNSSLGSLNLDTDKNIQPRGLDDSQRPSLDNPSIPATEPEEKPTKSFRTYEELRRRNREEFEARQSPGRLSSYQSSMPQTSSSSWQYPTEGRSEQFRSKPTPSSGDGKNKYGDDWDN